MSSLSLAESRALSPVPVGVDQQIVALVQDGKPLPLNKRMADANDTERIELLTQTVKACSQALTSGTITEHLANLRFRLIVALDDSTDHDNLSMALEGLEDPDRQTVIASLSTTTMLSLAQPDTKIAATIVECAPPKTLASMANSIAGKAAVAELRRNKLAKDKPFPAILDDPELAHSRDKAVRRTLGQLIDLIAETGEEPLENFAIAIAKFQPKPDKLSSPLFETICLLADEDERESAINLLELLPETIQIVKIKHKLGLE